MLFYFHFLYSFPFNVISVATVLCFCGFHPPVVSTLPWFPPSCSFHLPMVSTLPWFPPSCGFHLPMVTLWFPPFRGFHPVWLLCGLHPPIISIFVWFSPSRGYSGCPFHGLHFCSLHSAVVSTLPWFSSLRGSHPPMITPWCPFCGLHFCGLHSAMVSTLPWFASSCGSHPPCGYFVVSLPWFALSWFTLCCGFHPPMVCIFTWFSPSLWLLCGVPFMVCTIMWFTLCHGFCRTVKVTDTEPYYIRAVPTTKAFIRTHSLLETPLYT